MRNHVADVTVRPISLGEVGRFNACLDEHHWLGRRLTGQVLRYVAELDGQWRRRRVRVGRAELRRRDKFLGWRRERQHARLIHVTNNQRLCVLPAGRRPNLASAVLARLLRRQRDDYLAVYGHRVLMVETFTDPSRHCGACYAAANFPPGWIDARVRPQRWFLPLSRQRQAGLAVAAAAAGGLGPVHAV